MPNSSVHRANLASVTCAALLHDVGKVGQRAHRGSEGLSDSTRGLRDYLCPSSKDGRKTHTHVLYTNEFCEIALKNLPAPLNLADIANLASYHHRPGNELQNLITKADQLSARMERGEQSYVSSARTFRSIRLFPVSGALNLCGEPHEINQSFRMNRFGDEDLLPTSPQELSDQTDKYHALWTNLCGEVSGLHFDDPLKLVNTVLGKLEKYLWAVPAATNVQRPDISLFDHLKSTAAIATCLFHNSDKQKPFLMAAGSVGKIQKFIAGERDAGGKGLAKSLRGRSFLASTLSDVASAMILKKLGLPRTQIIMSAGSHFLALLPNTGEALQALDETKAGLNKWLTEDLRGALTFSLASLSLSEDQIATGILPARSKLQQSLALQKKHGFSSLKGANGWDEESWVQPGFTGANSELCENCRSEEGNPSNSEDGSVRLCDRCSDYQQLGRKLAKDNVMALFPNDNGQFKISDWSFSIGVPAIQDLSIVELLADFRGHDTQSVSAPSAPILKNTYVPLDKSGAALEFANIAEKSSGAKLLGFLKADIDDLGFLFNKGLNDDPNLSRFATLSRSLEYFFAGYLYHMIETRYPYTYTVFSGGDDLLLIGPWDSMFSLADELRDKFAQYTCQNPNWGLSAAIALVKPHTPVRHAVERVNYLLARSKRQLDKDSITALETTFKWPDFRRAVGQAEQLTQWILCGAVNPGKVFRLISYGQRLKEFNDTGNTTLLSVIPQLIYDLTRNWGDTTAEQQEAKRWAQGFTNPEHPDLALLPFVCEYAIKKAR